MRTGSCARIKEEMIMSLLSRFRVLTKILAIVAFLAAITAGITAVGIRSLKSLSDATDVMEVASKQAMLAQQLNANLMAVNRGEFRIAADPRPESVAEVRRLQEQEIGLFKARLAELLKSSDPETRSHVTQIESGWAAYLKDLEGTIRAAEAVKSFQMTAELERLRNEALSSRVIAEKVRGVLLDLSKKLDANLVAVSKAATDQYVQASNWMLVLTAVGIALGIGFGFMIGQFGISKPIRALVACLQRMAKGEEIDVVGAERGDEVGETAKAVVGIKEMLADKARREAEEKADAERRDAEAKRTAAEREALQQRAAEEKAAADRKAAMHRLADDFERAVGSIIDTVTSASTELEAAANTLTHTAETTQKLSTVVASASEEASSNVQSVASATEEMTGSVDEISRQVQESSNIANQAVEQARKTDARINELSQAASRIGDVVKLISAVAEQTNLLALNATIEAARAGEAGKGFAVVAQEVKALAAQTAKATGEISTQIAGMQTATQDSVTAIKEIGDTINRISQIAATIAAAVEEQGAATQEIARNVQEAAKGTTQVASNIVNVNRGANETGSASTQVLASAQSLAGESSHLKIEVQKFLQTVRAA
jgi:methyl-accepting chemotaxis protein